MADKTMAEMQAIVGYPTYKLIDNGTSISPLEAWDPPSKGRRRKFTAHDLYHLFHTECIAFVGDSLLRRLADTLHILIQNRNNPTILNTSYIHNWDPNKMAPMLRRRIEQDDDDDDPSSFLSKDYYLTEEQRRKEHGCLPGTIDNLWYPDFETMKKFNYHQEQRNYTLIVVGYGPWEQRRGNPLAWKQTMNKTIQHLYDTIPKSVPIVWKTGSWAYRHDWNFMEFSNETRLPYSNYFVYVANKEAKEAVSNISADNLRFLDWSKEILPYSFSERNNTNMVPENNDPNTWHVGPKARGLFLQMLASEFVQYKYGGVMPNSYTDSDTDSENVPSIATNEEKYKDSNNDLPVSLQSQSKFLQFAIGGCLACLTWILLVFRRRRRRRTIQKKI